MFTGKNLALLPTLAMLLLIAGVDSRVGYGPGAQEWGHIEVRPGAHLFYWLYLIQSPMAYSDAPTVIWLQGGPGASSTGFGNFAELGPVHINGSERACSWAQHANLLFIDNPVGTGFSFVDDIGLLVTNNQEIGSDMINFLIQFYATFPDLVISPLYIFSESYGGKMTVEIARQLSLAIKNKNINVDFRGVALGDAWISPVDSTNTWAGFLVNNGVVDQQGRDIIERGAMKIQKEIDEGNWNEATYFWGVLEGIIDQESNGVDVYNILTKIPFSSTKRRQNPNLRLYANHVKRNEDEELDALMNGPVRKALGIPSTVIFGAQKSDVFNALSEDFMKPVTSVVEELLNTTDLSINVLTGQLDLIVDTLGTVQWVDRLKWHGSEIWNLSIREPIVVNGYVEGYVKSYDKLSLYWVDRAGHMIPTDNPTTGIEILNRIIGN